MGDGSFEQAMQHEQAMRNLQAELEYLPIKMLSPKIAKDGDSWFCLLGEDIQSGIVGWGDNPNNAILAFGYALHEKDGSAVK
jgi:hypothetical protein